MLLEVKNLRTEFKLKRGTVRAVDDVSFTIDKGEILAIVGESGSGKSVSSLSLMGLIQKPGKGAGGEILFGSQDLTKLSQKELQKIRGNKISMIFQEPMTSLNPVWRIKDQIMENIMTHMKMSKKEALARTIEMLDTVGIPSPAERANDYPHQMSGGMRQRVMTAMALSCEPDLLIADEPTTALDVTIQAQILDLMRNLKSKLNSSIMLITHDLGVIAEMADYVVVMYAGKVVEEASVVEIFKNPMHPYTVGLLESKPLINSDKTRLYTIPGQVPNPLAMPEGCYFHPRCEKAMDICKKQQPTIKDNNEHNVHKVACWLYEGGK